MIDIRDVEQLINIIESADGEPLVIRDMILEGDAIDMIAYILNKPPSVTTWKDVDLVLEQLRDIGEYKFHDELFVAIYGVDLPSVPEVRNDTLA